MVSCYFLKSLVRLPDAARALPSAAAAMHSSCRGFAVLPQRLPMPARSTAGAGSAAEVSNRQMWSSGQHTASTSGADGRKQQPNTGQPASPLQTSSHVRTSCAQCKPLLHWQPQASCLLTCWLSASLAHHACNAYAISTSSPRNHRLPDLPNKKVQHSLAHITGHCKRSLHRHESSTESEGTAQLQDQAVMVPNFQDTNRRACQN